MKPALMVLTALLSLVPSIRAQEIPAVRTPSRLFLGLTAASYATATADSVTTIHNLDRGAVELNPFVRPFTEASHPLYLTATEATATGANWLGWRFLHSDRPFVRRLWWLPQAIEIGANLTGLSFTETHEVHRGTGKGARKQP